MATPDRSRKPRSPARRRWLVRLRPWLQLLVGVGIAFGATYFVLLDMRVRSEFGETQWRVPAHVYTRPLEIHDGRDIGRAAVVRHLEATGYRRARDVSLPGRYHVDGETIELHTRPFAWPDGEEPARRLTVRFDGGAIERVDTREGRPALARIEPERMGSIYPGRREDRVLVRLEDMPPLLTEILLAVEDQDFHSHMGVQPSAILRAAWANLRAGRTVQGGSTLTQQLVKNFFLSHERTLGRKFTEALMALSLEWHYDKEQILGAYLNEVYLGQDGERSIHGFGLGARHWFNRPPGELDLSEIALLVGMVKGPSQYDPRAHPERARQRRNTVLRRLARTDTVDRQRAEAAMDAPLGVVDRDAVRHHAYPAYLDLVRRELARNYEEKDLREAGLRVFTHLDPIVQKAAEDALEQRLERLDEGGDRLQGAVVVADHDNGAVRAIVGDREGSRSGYNRALSARRSVGSVIKPAVCYTALERPDEYTLVTPLRDEPLRVERSGSPAWEPKNHSGEFHGEVPLIDGLVHSYNAASARLGLEVGLPAVGRTLQRLRAKPAEPLVPADLLGSTSLSPLEVTRMYQTFAAGGFDTPLSTIAAVQSGDGDTLSEDSFDVRQALDPAPTYLVNAALERVTREGTGSALRHLLPGRRVAGKTGTTDDLRDSWFAGFDGRRVGVVWVGRDDHRPGDLTGSTGALRVWADMMGQLSVVQRRSTPPPGIVEVPVDPVSGYSLPDDCGEALRLPFIEGSVPRRARRCDPGSLWDAGRSRNVR
ncbi:MAG: penicillin-binding protein 1B [Halofilum sp. (in: g-proteobacteria)]